jgi:hypothetical protein
MDSAAYRRLELREHGQERPSPRVLAVHELGSHEMGRCRKISFQTICLECSGLSSRTMPVATGIAPAKGTAVAAMAVAG